MARRARRLAATSDTASVNSSATIVEFHSARRRGVVTLRDAVVRRVKASFAELGSAGLGTVEHPVRTYEVGADPADWPAASAATAQPIAVRSGGPWPDPWALGTAAVVLLISVFYLAFASRPSPALTDRHGPRTESPGQRAENSLVRWQQGEPGEPEDEAANTDNVGPADAYDGTYAGTATMRADARVVTYRITVVDGVGSGTQSRLDCGTAPLSLRISPSGTVSGMVLVFGSTCLKTELALRGRATGDTIWLRLGSQHMDLSKAAD